MNTTTKTPSAGDRLAKLKQLQKLKAQSFKTNRRELFLEQKKKNTNQTNSSLPSQSEGEVGEMNKATAQRLKNLDYTLEESEEWELREQRKRENRTNSGFQDYSQLAQESYRKEVSKLSKSSKIALATASTKTKQLQLTQYDSNSDEDSTQEEDYSNKPSKQAIDDLVSSLEASSSRKYKSRMDKRAKNEANGESVIGGSTKEKDFNLKLCRYISSNSQAEHH